METNQKNHNGLFHNAFIFFIISFLCIFPAATLAQGNETNTTDTTSITYDQIHYINIQGYIHNLTDEIWCLNKIRIDMGDIGAATCTYDDHLRKCVCYDMYLPAFEKPSTLFGIEYIMDSAKKVKIQEYEQKLNQSETEMKELDKKLGFMYFVITFSIFCGVFAYMWVLVLFFWIVKIFPNWRWRLGD